MPETSVTYHLPMSVVRISGTRTTTHDSCLSEQPAPTTETSTALVVVADPKATSQVQLHQGWFRQTQASLALTEDGRLSSAVSETSGEVGTLVRSVISTAATVAGLFKAAEAVDEARACYAQKRPVEAGLLSSYSDTVVMIETQLAEHLRSMAYGVPDKLQLDGLARLEKTLAGARVQLEKHEQHFKVWRAAQVVSVVEKHEYDVPVDEAAKVVITADGRVSIPEGAPETRKAWEKLGIVVQAQPVATTARTARPGRLSPFRGAHVRLPRPVQIKTWKRSATDPERAVLVSVERRLVVDSQSPRAWFTFNTSLWSKRKTAVTFGAAGGLVTYEYSGDSVGTAIAKTLAEVPADMAEGLEEAGTLRADLAALRNARTEEAIVRTKLQMEQLQAQLSYDGLAATEDGYVELERLKHQKQLLEAGNAVIQLPTQNGAADIAHLQHEVEVLKLQHELAALKD